MSFSMCIRDTLGCGDCLRSKKRTGLPETLPRVSDGSGPAVEGKLSPRWHFFRSRCL